MINICYIISGIDKALAFEWIYELTDPTRYKLHFLLLHHRRGGLENFLEENSVPYLRVNYSSKTAIPIAILKTLFYLKRNKIQLVHCHLLDAGLTGLTAAWLLGIKKRIYTRHYSTYHHVYFPKGVLYDKYINLLSTHIVAVSSLVKNVLLEKEKTDPGKVHLIPHGFPLENFNSISEESISNLKEKYGFNLKYPVIGVVARYTEWKGIQYIIPAFERLLHTYPESFLVLANARGAYKEEINRLLQRLPQRSFTEISFEDDLFTLFKSFDVFVHTPVDSHSEAFGQVYVEAMAAGKACIFTLSGNAAEVAKDQVNACVVPYKNSDAIYDSIIKLLGDQNLAAKLGEEAKKEVIEQFSLRKMIHSLEELYG